VLRHHQHFGCPRGHATKRPRARVRAGHDEFERNWIERLRKNKQTSNARQIREQPGSASRPLAPGQTHTFHLPGKYMLTTSVSVDILVDYYYRVLEIREDNNYMHKILGPH
jgi:hypothetical protein